MEQTLSPRSIETTAKDPSCTSHFHARFTDALGERVRRFTAHLKREFAAQIVSDPGRFKKQVLRLIRHGLPPRPGRPNDPHLDAACRMIEDGKTVKQVLRIQIPDFDRLDTYGRYLAEKGFRAAIARRRKHTTSSGSPRTTLVGQFPSAP
jgi:hypothetical protein